MTLLRVEVIRDDESFGALAREWDELVNRAGIEHPFLRYGWVRTWWQCFGAGAQLYLVTVRRGETLVALAPLMRVRVAMYGLPVWRLEFMANVHTPRFDFVIAEQADEAYALILDHLREQAPSWDVLMLPELAASSRTASVLEPLAAARSLRSGAWVAGASPRISLLGSFEAFFERLSSKRRSKLRNRLQRLALLGEVSLEVVEDAAHLSDALRDGLQLEAAGWKGEAGTAISRNEDLSRFYGLVSEQSARLDTLRLLFLNVGGKRIAFGYCLLQGRTLFLLKSGYDPEYAVYSPFTVLMLLAIEGAFREGLEVFDLLGCDEPWKRTWTDQRIERRWLFFYRNTPKGLAIYYLKAVILPWIKHARVTLRGLRGGSVDSSPGLARRNVRMGS